MKITAIIPTRGDVDVSPIVTHLRTYKEIGHVLVVASDTPYSRYVWAARADTDLIYTQDDDCITDIEPLLERFPFHYRGRPGFVNAMTPDHAAQYPGAQTLIGFGCLFHKSLTELPWGEMDALFYREADRVFATINPHTSVFPKIDILPHAHNPNRLWKQPDHLAARDAINRRIFEVTGIEAGCL